MFSQEVQVTNQVGLYARPATFFIQCANGFKSTILVEKEERRVNAKSLLERNTWDCSSSAAAYRWSAVQS